MNIEPERAKGESGNTESLSPGVKKQGNQCKRWAFTTWIRGGEDTIEPEARRLRALLLTFSKTFCFSAERCGTTGRLHFQGRVVLNQKKRLTELKKLWGDDSHFSVERNEDAHIKYVKKDETHIAGPWTEQAKLRNTLEYEELYTWQKTVVDFCKNYADDRTVNWYWEENGKVGKSALARYFIDNFKECLYVDGGRKEDIAQYVATSGIRNWDNPIILFNIPRQKTTISYSAIEALKDGMIFSPKYESGMIRFNSPHIIVFANFEPDEKQLALMSADRWLITKVEKL